MVVVLLLWMARVLNCVRWVNCLLAAVMEETKDEEPWWVAAAAAAISAAACSRMLWVGCVLMLYGCHGEGQARGTLVGVCLRNG